MESEGGPCVVCKKIKSSMWMDEMGSLLLVKGKPGKREAVGEVWYAGCWKRRGGK